jgi:hypothetical protein
MSYKACNKSAQPSTIMLFVSIQMNEINGPRSTPPSIRSLLNRFQSTSEYLGGGKAGWLPFAFVASWNAFDCLSQRNPKLAVPLGFIVGRHNILCCAFVLHLISVGFFPDNQAN